MFNFDYPADMTAGRICLEMSLKPFKKLDDDYINRVARELFEGWSELIHYADSISVMFWTSDGSEILQYSGDVNDRFEWGRYIGIANPKPGFPPVPLSEMDPNISIHQRPHFYIDNPPEMRYSDLKRIITALKKAGREMFGKEVRMIETFDPGPEFAYSDFKFHRHPELNRGSTMANMWIDCASKLHADSYVYAAYPDGIPEGTHFGSFLAKQFMRLAGDVGFDSIWLSNGFGYSLNAWHWTGEVFDGEKFDGGAVAEISSRINEFWKDFTAETGDMLIESRGSNLSTGMDIASHGSPLDDIYKNNMISPPNSPWAAIDYRFGLELAGYMSHIAEIPSGGYLFRYYPHDPWWHNSPWFDRYGSSPHDIYLPLALARISDDGSVTHPMGINFLSADDSYGNLPRRCPIEITPHLLNAIAHYPDEPGLLTWLYPFDYYCQTGLRDGKPDRMFMDDWLIENAIDNSLPLASVVSDAAFATAPKETFDRTVLLLPIPQAGSSLEMLMFKAIGDGHKLLVYGNPAYASEKVRELLGLKETSGIEGELTLTTKLYHDETADEMPTLLYHDSLLSDGPITELYSGKPDIEVTSTVCCGGGERVYSTFNRRRNIAYVRGSFPHERIKGALPYQLDRTKYFHVSKLLRGAVEAFGIKVRVKGESVTQPDPIVFTSVRDNAMFFTEFAKDTTMRLKLETPYGMPLIIGSECVVTDGGAEYSLAKSSQLECRAYLRQDERSVVVCERVTAEHPTLDQRIKISGLKDAVLTFTPPLDADFRIVSNNASMVALTNIGYTMTEDGRAAVTEKVSGTVFFAWKSDKNQPRELL